MLLLVWFFRVCWQLEVINPGAGALLSANGVDLVDAAYKLANTLPMIISVQLNTSASRAVLTATISDIINALGTVALPPLPPKQEWLKQRALNRPHASLVAHGSIAPANISLEKRGSLPAKPSAARVPRGCPRLPEAYTPRVDLFETLVSKLTKTSVGSSNRVVARGMGGVGKTVLAAAVVRDTRVLSAFDKVGWISIGQKPIMLDLQRQLLQQLGGTVPSSGDEHDLLEVLEQAASGVRLLVVIDDPWIAGHEELLNCVDGDAGGAVLITTRIRNLVPNQAANEVELSVLTKDDAVALLLAAGQVVLPPGQMPPPAACEAVELCGRLPLCVCIAGGMIREHEDNWEQWLVPALSESDGAEMRTRSVGETGVSVEERVLRSSLRSIKREERDGVAALFLFTSVFAEDVTIPAAVIDALAGEILVEALAEGAGMASGLGAGSPSGSRAGGESAPGSSPQERWQQLRRASSTVSSVRRWLRIAIDHSLILGSISEGIRMHDLVRDYARQIAASRKDGGGLAAIQRRAFSAFLAAAPEGGFADLALASTAEKGAELSLYFAVQAPFHLSEAFPANVPIATTGGKVDELVLGLLEEAERTGQDTMRLHAAMGISAAQLEAAAERCENASNWLNAGRMWTTLGASFQNGLELRRAMLRATAALAHAGDGVDEEVARELEAKCWLRVMFCAGTGLTWGSPEMDAALARVKVLGENVCATALLFGLLTRPESNWTAICAACCWVRTVDEHNARYLSFEEEHGRELAEMFTENVRSHGQYATIHLRFNLRPSFPTGTGPNCCPASVQVPARHPHRRLDASCRRARYLLLSDCRRRPDCTSGCPPRPYQLP